MTPPIVVDGGDVAVSSFPTRSYLLLAFRIVSFLVQFLALATVIAFGLFSPPLELERKVMEEARTSRGIPHAVSRFAKTFGFFTVLSALLLTIVIGLTIYDSATVRHPVYALAHALQTMVFILYHGLTTLDPFTLVERSSFNNNPEKAVRQLVRWTPPDKRAFLPLWALLHAQHTLSSMHQYVEVIAFGVFEEIRALERGFSSTILGATLAEDVVFVTGAFFLYGVWNLIVWMMRGFENPIYPVQKQVALRGWKHNVVFYASCLAIAAVSTLISHVARNGGVWKDTQTLDVDERLEDDRTFVIVSTLGAGSFGKVLRARVSSTPQLVALKYVNKEQRSERELTSLKREIEISAKIVHPGVVLTMACLETPRQIVIVQEVGITDLFQVLKADGRLPESLVRTIAAQLIDALHHLHVRKIVHRDVKPQNVLVLSRGAVALCDFGFARFVTSHTAMLSTIKGTPLYMAPEVVQELPYNHTADIWSLGVILFELASGSPPFFAESLVALIKHVVQRPLELPEHFSPELKSFLARLLDKDPTKRLGWQAMRSHPFIAPVLTTTMTTNKTDADRLRFMACLQKSPHLLERSLDLPPLEPDAARPLATTPRRERRPVVSSTGGGSDRSLVGRLPRVEEGDEEEEGGEVEDATWAGNENLLESDRAEVAKVIREVEVSLAQLATEAETTAISPSTPPAPTRLTQALRWMRDVAGRCDVRSLLPLASRTGMAMALLHAPHTVRIHALKCMATLVHRALATTAQFEARLALANLIRVECLASLAAVTEREAEEEEEEQEEQEVGRGVTDAKRREHPPPARNGDSRMKKNGRRIARFALRAASQFVCPTFRSLTHVYPWCLDEETRSRLSWDDEPRRERWQSAWEMARRVERSLCSAIASPPRASLLRFASRLIVRSSAFEGGEILETFTHENDRREAIAALRIVLCACRVGKSRAILFEDHDERREMDPLARALVGWVEKALTRKARSPEEEEAFVATSCLCLAVMAEYCHAAICSEGGRETSRETIRNSFRECALDVLFGKNERRGKRRAPRPLQSFAFRVLKCRMEDGDEASSSSRLGEAACDFLLEEVQDGEDGAMESATRVLGTGFGAQSCGFGDGAVWYAAKMALRSVAEEDEESNLLLKCEAALHRALTEMECSPRAVEMGITALAAMKAVVATRTRRNRALTLAERLVNRWSHGKASDRGGGDYYYYYYDGMLAAVADWPLGLGGGIARARNILLATCGYLGSVLSQESEEEQEEEAPEKEEKRRMASIASGIIHACDVLLLSSSRVARDEERDDDDDEIAPVALVIQQLLASGGRRVARAIFKAELAIKRRKASSRGNDEDANDGSVLVSLLLRNVRTSSRPIVRIRCWFALEEGLLKAPTRTSGGTEHEEVESILNDSLGELFEAVEREVMTTRAVLMRHHHHHTPCELAAVSALVQLYRRCPKAARATPGHLSQRLVRGLESHVETAIRNGTGDEVEGVRIYSLAVGNAAFHDSHPSSALLEAVGPLARVLCASDVKLGARTRANAAGALANLLRHAPALDARLAGGESGACKALLEAFWTASEFTHQKVMLLAIETFCARPRCRLALTTACKNPTLEQVLARAEGDSSLAPYAEAVRVTLAGGGS